MWSSAAAAVSFKWILRPCSSPPAPLPHTTTAIQLQGLSPSHSLSFSLALSVSPPWLYRPPPPPCGSMYVCVYVCLTHGWVGMCLDKESCLDQDNKGMCLPWPPPLHTLHTDTHTHTLSFSSPLSHYVGERIMRYVILCEKKCVFSQACSKSS